MQLNLVLTTCINFFKRFHLLTSVRFIIDLAVWAIAIFVAASLRIEPNGTAGFIVVVNGFIVFSPLLFLAGSITGIYRHTLDNKQLIYKFISYPREQHHCWWCFRISHDGWSSIFLAPHH